MFQEIISDTGKRKTGGFLFEKQHIIMKERGKKDADLRRITGKRTDCSGNR